MDTSNNEWLHIYQHNLTAAPPPAALRWSGDVTEATTMTTTATMGSSSSTNTISNQLGRVTRPTTTRRRTRASRRTPTTLLNTDTTNFRAMVQQFTGGNFCGSGVNGGGDGGSAAFMVSPATVAPRQPLSRYNTNSSGFSYYAADTGGAPPPAVGGYNIEQQNYYTIVAENGGDHQQGFVQRF